MGYGGWAEKNAGMLGRCRWSGKRCAEARNLQQVSLVRKEVHRGQELTVSLKTVGTFCSKGVLQVEGVIKKGEDTTT